jgi:Glycosyltransferase family 87
MKRYWPIAVVVAFIGLLLWLQPSDGFVLPSNTRQVDYVLPGNTARYLTDDIDLLAYAIRAENAARGRQGGLKDAEGKPCEPWEEARSPGYKPTERYFLEYPPLALQLFRLGHLGSTRNGAEVSPWYLDGHQCKVAEWKPTAENDVDLVRSYRHTIRVYTVLLGAGLVSLMIFVGRCYPHVSLWLFLLPSFLYFSLCRFDLLTAGLLLVSITFADKKRPWASGLAMGLAIALKMYPLAVAPIVLRYAARSWTQALVWCVMTAVPVVVSYGSFYLSDGLDGILVPLQFQLSRGLEPNWCFIGRFIPESFAEKGYLRALPVLALSLLFSVRRPESVEVLLERCALVVLLFISFQTFFSPQWGQWIAVLLIPLVRRHPWIIGWLLVHDLWTYCYFPFLFDLGMTNAPSWDDLHWVSGVHTWMRAFLYIGLVGGLMLAKRKLSNSS